MNENKYTYPALSLQRLQHLLPLLSVVLLLTVAGCRKDDLNRGKTLIFASNGTSQTGSDGIREIDVFVFDDREQLINRTGTQPDGAVELDYPQTSTFHCIAWGNSKDSGLELSPLQSGDPLAKGAFTLKKLSSIQDGTTFSNTPPDLFRGATQTDNNTIGTRLTIPIVMQPATASIHITIEGLLTIDGLQEATGTADGNFTLEVSQAAARIDFEGNYSGKAVHSLTGSFNSKKEYIIPSFHIFPPATGNGIRLDVSHGGKLLQSITQTSDGQRLLAEAGRKLELLILFRPDGSAEARLPGWTPTDVEVAYPK